MSEENNMHLSDQAVGALMMALQRSLLEQSDIVPVLKNMDFVPTTEGLIVKNPPLVKFDADGMVLYDEETNEE